jgi:methionine-rich copper-binding protein CopC
MSVLRIALERLLVLVFWLTRSAFLAFALATATTFLGTAALGGGPEGGPWVAVVARACLGIGATSLVAAVLLFVAPRLPAPAPSEDESPPAWIWGLGLSLLALPALAWANAGDFVALSREILALLDEIGFWDAFARGGQYSGLVMLPVLALLFVPALEAIAAFFVIALPLALLALLPTRSPRFPRLFAMLAVSQAGLVLASAIGAGAFASVAAEASGVMGEARDAEVLRAGADLARAAAVLGATAKSFVTPMLGTLLWLPVLLTSPRAGAYFRARTAEAPATRPSAAPIERGTPEPTRRSVVQPTPAKAAPDSRNASLALIALGTLMMAVGAGEALLARTRYVGSDPAPGATLAAPPAAVRVRFEGALHPASSLHVDRTAPGELASRVSAAAELDPGDAERATLKVALESGSAGIYHVSWHALPASGGGARAGSFRFAVGMPLPSGGELEDHVAGERAKRRTVVGGLALALLGAALPRFGRRP